MLSGTNIYKSFGERKVLQGVSGSIGPGEIVALLGPSGSGKTTFLRALAMTELADSGVVAVDDLSYTLPLKNKKITPPWPKLTVVFQELFLWPHLTLAENILLPARNVGHENILTALAEVVQLLGMESFIDSYPNEASLGQRQRVAIARALMLKPRYILMDEITSALDIEQVHNILSFLPKLKARGIGILLITHHINFARRAADKVLFLADGKIAEEGGPEILDKPQSPRLKQFMAMIEETH
jgi:ABC-type polar amino acid transport system ATPase subunit